MAAHITQQAHLQRVIVPSTATYTVILEVKDAYTR
jgi:hypothetical protein